VAVDGRLLALFLANEDEVEVLKDYKVPVSMETKMQFDFGEEEEDFDDK